MVIILYILGSLLIIGGITIKITKWLWIHQGLVKRPVDVAKYTNYMGVVDVFTGICYITMGFLFHYFEIPDILAFVICITYIAFLTYGEFKFRIKSD